MIPGLVCALGALPEDDQATVHAFAAFLSAQERLPMKVYLAARYSRRLELCAYRSQLGLLGIEVTSRWLNGKHQIDDKGQPIGDDGEKWVEDEGSGTAPARLRQHFAQEDVADVLAAGTLIAFTETPRASTSRGGRHVELGIGIGTGKRLIVVGPRENVFTWLPQVEHFDTWPEFVEWLDARSAVGGVEWALTDWTRPTGVALAWDIASPADGLILDDPTDYSVPVDRSPGPQRG